MVKLYRIAYRDPLDESDCVVLDRNGTIYSKDGGWELLDFGEAPDEVVDSLIQILESLDEREDRKTVVSMVDGVQYLIEAWIHYGQQ